MKYKPLYLAAIFFGLFLLGGGHGPLLSGSATDEIPQVDMLLPLFVLPKPT